MQTFRSLFHMYTKSLGIVAPRPIHGKLCREGPWPVVGVAGLMSVLVWPSPNCHRQFVTIAVDSLVKFTCRGHPLSWVRLKSLPWVQRRP